MSIITPKMIQLAKAPCSVRANILDRTLNILNNPQEFRPSLENLKAEINLDKETNECAHVPQLLPKAQGDLLRTGVATRKGLEADASCLEPFDSFIEGLTNVNTTKVKESIDKMIEVGEAKYTKLVIIKELKEMPLSYLRMSDLSRLCRRLAGNSQENLNSISEALRSLTSLTQERDDDLNQTANWKPLDQTRTVDNNINDIAKIEQNHPNILSNLLHVVKALKEKKDIEEAVGQLIVPLIINGY